MQYVFRNLFIKDWCMAAPEEKTRKNAQWKDVVVAMSAYYKPTENITLKHFLF